MSSAMTTRNLLKITLLVSKCNCSFTPPQDQLPPPYYSVAVHTQPPLKSYEEVVYGAGSGLDLYPASQPRYIPQYPPPPVAPPQLVLLSTRECRQHVGSSNKASFEMCVCVQLPAVKRAAAAARTPGVTREQEGSYWCSACWHWPSGLEVWRV